MLIQKETHTHTHNTLSFNYICQFKLGNKSTKKESERLTLLPSGHGDPDGVTSLENELVSVPRLEGLSADESCGRKLTPQWTWSASCPPHEHPISRGRQALLLRNQAYLTQELVEHLGWNRFARSPGHCMSPRLGFLPPSLGSPLLQMTAPSTEWCSKKLGYVLGTLGKGEGEETQTLGVSSGTFHTS